jgi:hypothetical protein
MGAPDEIWQEKTGKTIDYWFKRSTTTAIILDETQLL